MNHAWRYMAASLVSSALVGGCDSEESSAPRLGTIAVAVYGESFIEEGIPAEAMDDGWAISFQSFAIELDGIEVAGEAFASAAPYDLAEASAGVGQPIGSAEVPVGDYTDARFTIERVVIQGSASKGGQTLTFDWTFELGVAYGECDASATVAEGEPGRFEITVHADHLFYDSLVSESPALRFQPLADADADGDGELTAMELEAADIGDYDPGNEDVADLWSFLSAQAKTMGHANGESHCELLEGSP